MKKILKLIIIFIALIIAGTVLMIVVPNISRTCKIKEYGISMKVPYAYEQLDNASSNELINLYNSNNGIRITASKLEDSFWTSGDIVSRMDEYLRVVSAVNYDSSMVNIVTNIDEKTKNKIGTISYELMNTQGKYKNIAIITNEEVGSIVIEIAGNQDSMKKEKEKIDKIVDSISIKK